MTSKSNIKSQIESTNPETITVDTIESIFDDIIEVHHNTDTDVKSVYQDLIELLDTSIVDTSNKEIDWELLEHLMNEYRPGDVKAIPIQYPISNIVARNIIRQRTWTDDPATIPTDALRYLRMISYDIDGDYAAEEMGAYAWGWDHPEEPVNFILGMKTRGRNQIDLTAYLPHLMVCDQDACTEFIVQDLLAENLAYGEIEECSGMNPTTIAERKYNDMRELYGSIKNIGSRKDSHGNTIEKPSRPSYWHIFDLRPEFEYKQENLNKLQEAFPDSIIKSEGKLTESYSL